MQECRNLRAYLAMHLIFWITKSGFFPSSAWLKTRWKHSMTVYKNSTGEFNRMISPAYLTGWGINKIAASEWVGGITAVVRVCEIMFIFTWRFADGAHPPVDLPVGSLVLLLHSLLNNFSVVLMSVVTSEVWTLMCVLVLNLLVMNILHPQPVLWLYSSTCLWFFSLSLLPLKISSCYFREVEAYYLHDMFKSDFRSHLTLEC